MIKKALLCCVAVVMTAVVFVLPAGAFVYEDAYGFDDEASVVLQNEMADQLSLGIWGVFEDGFTNIHTTTRINILFNVEPVGFSADNVAIAGPPGSVVNVDGVTVVGNSAHVYISGTWEQGDIATVWLTSTSGFDITPTTRTVTLHRRVDVNRLTRIFPHADPVTSRIFLDFILTPQGLTADNIAITSALGSVVSIDSVDIMGFSASVNISGMWGHGEVVTVSLVNYEGLDLEPFSTDITLSRIADINFIGVTANGVADTLLTTQLTLHFDAPPIGLGDNMSDITIWHGGVGSRVLSINGNDAVVLISGTWAEGDVIDVDVRISSPPGMNVSAQRQRVMLHNGDISTDAAFLGVRANGAESSSTTTSLSLSFDFPAVFLQKENISIIGGEGVIVNINSVTNLPLGLVNIGISGVWDQGDVVTVIIDPYGTGLDITPLTQTVALNRTIYDVSFRYVRSNGTANFVTTTRLALELPFRPHYMRYLGLTPDDITITGNMGAVVNVDAIFDIWGSSDVSVYISGTWQQGEEVTVTLTNTYGFNFVPSSQNAILHRATATYIAFTGITANGRANTDDTTSLTLHFDAPPLGISWSNITITRSNGQNIDVGLSVVIGNSFLFSIIGEWEPGEVVTVTIDSPLSNGLTFTPYSRLVTLHREVGINGWRQIGWMWFFYVDGDRLLGWVDLGHALVYFIPELNGRLATGFVVIDGVTHEFAQDGAWIREINANGWNQINGQWFFYVDGTRQIGWVDLGHALVYFIPERNGALATGFVLIDGVRHEFGADGAWIREVIINGWSQINGQWFFYVDGTRQMGWLDLGHALVYFIPELDGALAIGFVVINGVTHEFGPDGAWIG